MTSRSRHRGGAQGRADRCWSRREVGCLMAGGGLTALFLRPGTVDSGQQRSGRIPEHAVQRRRVLRLCRGANDARAQRAR